MHMNPNAPIDLHAHTTASDGTLTPAELVNLAHESGLVALAITDHDTVGGVEEACRAGERMGIEVVTGVEISAEFSPEEMHVLGYFVDPESADLQETITWVQRSRRERNPAIAARLNELGIPLTMEEVAEYANGGLIGRPHFAQALIARGVVESTQEAFDRFLKPGAPAYVAKVKLEPALAIEGIHKAGGVAVLAHPRQLEMKNDEELFKLVGSLKDSGLDGVECYYSNLPRGVTATYMDMARKFDLAITGGSDFHGATKPYIHLGEVSEGDFVPYYLLDELRKRQQ